MKKLTELIKQAKAIKETGGNVQAGSPVFDGFCEFSYVFDTELAPLKGKSKNLPKAVSQALMTAYSYGIVTALSALKNGVVIHDESGKAVDKAFYSLDELLNEAWSLVDPDWQLENLDEELEDLKLDNLQDEEYDNESGDMDASGVTSFSNSPKSKLH